MKEKEFKVDKSKLIDVMGRMLTQGLFLEINYDDFAIYTLKDYHHTKDGKFYPSLKVLYLEMEDPTEYEFANKYLLGWPQWKRICENKVLLRYIVEWREELELKMKAKAVREMQALVNSEQGSFQAAKYLAEKGWDKRQAGRPSKAEIAKKIAIDQHVSDEFAGDVKRLEDYRKA